MKKNNKGFTLVEVIISIAILAIISGFIMEMFIVASRRSNLMENKDISFSMATEIVEIFKSSKTIDEDFQKKLSELDIEFGRSYFNKEWQRVDSADAKYTMDLVLTPLDNDVHELTIILQSLDEEESYININTARYFPRGGDK